MREDSLSFIYETLQFERATKAIKALGENLILIDDGQGKSLHQTEEVLEWCRENWEEGHEEPYNEFCQSHSVDSICDHNGDPSAEEIREKLKEWGLEEEYEEALDIFGAVDAERADAYDRLDDKGWAVYHKDEAGDPEAHEEDDGPWFYEPHDSQGVEVWSKGFATKKEALLACLDEISQG